MQQALASQKGESQRYKDSTERELREARTTADTYKSQAHKLHEKVETLTAMVQSLTDKLAAMEAAAKPSTLRSPTSASPIVARRFGRSARAGLEKSPSARKINLDAIAKADKLMGNASNANAGHTPPPKKGSTAPRGRCATPGGVSHS